RVDGPVLSGLDPIEAAQEAGRQRARPIGEPLNPPSPEAPPAAQDAQPPVTGPEALAADERLGTAPEIAAIEERLRQRERQALVQMLGLRDERELGFVRDRNRAHQMALESDAGARALLALDTSYDRALRTEPDEMVRSNLRQLQTEARAAVRQRHIQAAQEQARQIAETIAQASEAAFEAQDHARRGERWTHSVTSLSPRAEQEAAVLRSTLGLEPLPFLEEKQGGLLHILAKNRGPKVIESYFRVPGQDHMMVLERRLRNGGALLSQTVVTTERPLRERMVGMPGIRERELTYLPPRGTSATIEQIRAQDRTNLSPRTSGRKPRVRLRNYVSGPFTPGLIEGIYTDYGRAAGVPRNRLDGQLNTLRYGAGRRGGFWYWLTGGRF
ncbi:MAG TPA: hypothetical protein VLF67_00400, partial [Candidatus Saccharimonas sp.]|nr:hypothetical protein [Candidatus Saccharimonas sp.]